MFITDTQREYQNNTTARERKRDAKKDRQFQEKEARRIAALKSRFREEEMTPEERLKQWLRGRDVAL